MGLLPLEAKVTMGGPGSKQGHLGGVNAVRFNREGSYIISCGLDRNLILWNPHTGLPIKTYKGHANEVNDVSSSKDNSQLVSAGGDRAVFNWDVATGRVIRKFNGHLARVNAVKFSAESTVVASASYDQAVMLWDCRSRSFDPIQTLKGSRDSVTCVCFTKDSIVAAGVDGCLREYDVRMGQLTVDNIGEPITSLSISNDHQCILVSTLDSQLRLMDKARGDVLATYTGHVNSSYKIDSCLTNDDAHVVSGSEDGRIVFWDLVSARVVAEVKAHTRVVGTVTYHPTKHCFVSCSTDGTITTWEPSAAALAANAPKAPPPVPGLTFVNEDKLPAWYPRNKNKSTVIDDDD